MIELQPSRGGYAWQSAEACMKGGFDGDVDNTILDSRFQRVVERGTRYSPSGGHGSGTGAGPSGPAGQNAPEKKRSGGISWRVVVAGAVAAAVCAALVAVSVPATVVRNVEISGMVTVSAGELREWTGLGTDSSWFMADCGRIGNNVAAHPRIASVVVSRRFPDTVRIVVRERVPVSVVYAAGTGGRVEAHCVDETGVVFAPASDYTAALTLPVISGIEIRGLHYGLHLGGPVPALLESLAEVGRVAPVLVSAISELRLVVRSGAAPELLLYPVRYRVPVRMKPSLETGVLKSMMLVLDVMENEGLAPSIEELDVRTETFVYRTKEAVSG